MMFLITHTHECAAHLLPTSVVVNGLHLVVVYQCMSQYHLQHFSYYLLHLDAIPGSMNLLDPNLMLMYCLR